MDLGKLKTWPWFKPDGKPRPEWKLFTAPTWADARKDAQRAARDEAQKAGKSTTWNAALLHVVRNAAWDAERDAAWNAARDAVRNAANDAARYAAWDAEGDIAMAHAIETVPDIDPAHLAHVRARVDVWRKGYALLCDVGGVLYVYAVE